MASLTSRVARCEHGKMLRHDPEPTAAIAGTSGRKTLWLAHHSVPHIRVAWWHPPMPGQGPPRSEISFLVERTSDPSQNVIQVQAVKAGIRYNHDQWSANE
eukprot:scaffold35897_cov30-Phaeocystis_antarctica.AAC.1